MQYINSTGESVQETRCGERLKRAQRLVDEAEALIDDWSLVSSFSVAELADRLQVSKRTLYRAFHAWLGTGPYEIFLSRKLHAFRLQLLEGNYYRGKVTDAAILTGFIHFGRLAELYKNHFGELPSETGVTLLPRR